MDLFQVKQETFRPVTHFPDLSRFRLLRLTLRRIYASVARRYGVLKVANIDRRASLFDIGSSTEV